MFSTGLCNCYWLTTSARPLSKRDLPSLAGMAAALLCPFGQASHKAAGTALVPWCALYRNAAFPNAVQFWEQREASNPDLLDCGHNQETAMPYCTIWQTQLKEKER